MSWPKKPLAEVADFQLGKMLDQVKNRGDSRPYLANKNVRWGNFDFSELREMRFEESEFERFSLKNGDIVMCEGGEPGRCAIWRDELPNMMFQKALHRIRPFAGMDSVFLYFNLSHRARSGHFNGLLTGATIKHLPREKLALVQVDVPDLPTQQRIAGILSAYDSLIENNRRRIGLLEQAARLLYREWFVHLRFPGHEMAKIVDGLPEGWSRATIKEISSFISRGITPTYDEDAPGSVINQKCIRENRVSLLPARRQSKRVPHEKLIQKFDVLVNSTGAGTLGRVAQCFIEHPNLTVDSHVTILRPSFGLDALWFGQTVVDREGLIETLGRGATNQTELGKDDLGRVDVTVPPEGIRDQYGATVGPMLFQSQLLSDNIVKLTRARDLLLPRLMDGRIPV